MSFIPSLRTRIRPIFGNAILKRTYLRDVTTRSRQLGGLKTTGSPASGDPLNHPHRRFHSATATTTAVASTNHNNNNKNIFLDNLGALFLGGIVTVIVWLVRSYMNSQARNLLRDQVEATAHADPIELDDLRTANTELTAEQYLDIYAHVVASLQQQQQQQQQHGAELSVSSEPKNELRYDEFVLEVRQVMARKLGPAFTVQLGHLLDRVAASAMEKRNKSLTSDTMPILFWFTLLGLCLSNVPKERIAALYHILVSESNNNNNQETNTPVVVSLEHVTELVGYLQDTCQLVPDAQVVATTHTFPLQQYDLASPVQLVDRYRVQYKDEFPYIQDAEKLRDILTSNSICVWGECYKRSKR